MKKIKIIFLLLSISCSMIAVAGNSKKSDSENIASRSRSDLFCPPEGTTLSLEVARLFVAGQWESRVSLEVYKDGEIIMFSSRIYLQGTKLVIKNIVPADSGIYIFKIVFFNKNGNNESFASVKVEVQEVQ